MKVATTVLATVCLVLPLASAVARAALVEFTVDPNSSMLEIDSQTTIFGTPLGTTAQAPSSLSTSYSGSIFADVTPTTIQFVGGTALVAGNSGAWLPGVDYSAYPGDLEHPNGYVNTPVSANYGIITDLTSLGAVLGKQGLSPTAIRDLVISLTDAAPKPLSGTTFAEAGTATDFTSGAVYYSSGGTPPITDLATRYFQMPYSTRPAPAAWWLPEINSC